MNPVLVYTWNDGWTLYRVIDPTVVQEFLMVFTGSRFVPEMTPVFSISGPNLGSTLFFVAPTRFGLPVSSCGQLSAARLIPFLVDTIWLDGRTEGVWNQDRIFTPIFVPDHVYERAQDGRWEAEIEGRAEAWMEAYQEGLGAEVQAEIKEDLSKLTFEWLDWIFEDSGIPVVLLPEGTVEVQFPREQWAAPHQFYYVPIRSNWYTNDGGSYSKDLLTILLDGDPWLRPKSTEADWWKKHGGHSAFDLTAYRLLGMKTPIFWPLSKFAAWAKGQQNA